MSRKRELERFAPAGQVAMPFAPAQLALDGTPLEPAVDGAAESARIIAALETDPRQLTLDVPRAGELHLPPETPAERRKRGRREEKRRVRAEREERRRELLETRAVRKRVELCTRRASRLSKIKMARGLARAGRDRLERALAELPHTLRWRLYWAAVGQVLEELDAGELLECDRIDLASSRARNIIACVIFIWKCSVPAGRGRVCYGINGGYVAKAVLRNEQRGEAYSYSTVMNKLHRGDTPEGERWRDGTTGYLPAAAETGCFTYHQPRRAGDGRAPDTIPADQRGRDERTVDGRVVPGYAFVQFRFPAECCWPASQCTDEELEEAFEHGRELARARAAELAVDARATLERALDARQARPPPD